MAICPSAPLALRKTRKIGGDHQLAALIQISAALIAVATVPLMATLFRGTFNLSGWEVRPAEIALQVGRVQVLPVILGICVRQWANKAAEWMKPTLDRLANSLLVVLGVIIIVKTGPLLSAALLDQPKSLVLMALLVSTSLVVGWALSNGKTDHRVTTSLVTAMRNPGLALVLANQYAKQLEGLKAAILIYVFITLVLSWPVVRRARIVQS
jgi:predicted Na+-dependent transporter